jgi:hypothetical protein
MFSAMLTVTAIGAAGCGTLLAPPEAVDTPVAVSKAFAEAMLVTHDEKAPARLICNPTQGLEITTLRDDLSIIEQTKRLKSVVRFHDWQAEQEGTSASVTVRISVDFPKAPERNEDRNWRFDLTRSDRWRVCKTAPVPAPERATSSDGSTLGR